MTRNDVISFYDIIKKHGMMQRGINYGKGKKESVIFMSGRKDAPYVDKEIDGQIVYEGEDVFGSKEKKAVDQKLTKGNRDLYEAANQYIEGKRSSEPVQIYEKLGKGRWIDRGIFKLIGASRVYDSKRYVYRFILSAGDEEVGTVLSQEEIKSRHIPSEVQISVWKKDNGKCVQCGSDQNLHFDHIIPFSRGGSNSIKNIQILCSKCNLHKSDKIAGELSE